MEPIRHTTEGVGGNRTSRTWQPMELRYVGDVSELVQMNPNKSISGGDNEGHKQNAPSP